MTSLGTNTTTREELEDEFFRIEGRPEALAYVGGLDHSADGAPISVEERAALWYLAYWSSDGIARPSIAAVAMHLHVSAAEARTLLAYLVEKQLLTVKAEDLGQWTTDVPVFRFPMLRKGPGSAR